MKATEALGPEQREQPYPKFREAVAEVSQRAVRYALQELNRYKREPADEFFSSIALDAYDTALLLRRFFPDLQQASPQQEKWFEEAEQLVLERLNGPVIFDDAYAEEYGMEAGDIEDSNIEYRVINAGLLLAHGGAEFRDALQVNDNHVETAIREAQQFGVGNIYDETLFNNYLRLGVALRAIEPGKKDRLPFPDDITTEPIVHWEQYLGDFGSKYFEAAANLRLLFPDRIDVPRELREALYARYEQEKESGNAGMLVRAMAILDAEDARIDDEGVIQLRFAGAEISSPPPLPDRPQV